MRKTAGIIAFLPGVLSAFSILIAPVARAERLHERAAADFTHKKSSATSALAYNGQIDFTPAEINAHQNGVSSLIATTMSSMKTQIDLEKSAFAQCGMGVMYGYASPFSKLSSVQRQSYIAKNAKCATPPKVSDVGVTSCEIFANRFLAKGFSSIGQADVYKRINSYLNANDRDGLALIVALRKLGWKVLYWNTDTKTMPPLPADRHVTGVNPDDHLFDQNQAIKKHLYHGIAVDGLLTDFSPNPGSHTIKDESILSKFKNVPYFVGVSHAGFHVWSGSYGIVTESHSYYDPADEENIQIGEFEPQHASPTCRHLIIAGKPQTHCYYSGVIAIPPGPWVW